MQTAWPLAAAASQKIGRFLWRARRGVLALIGGIVFFMSRLHAEEGLLRANANDAKTRPTG